MLKTMLHREGEVKLSLLRLKARSLCVEPVASLLTTKLTKTT